MSKAIYKAAIYNQETSTPPPASGFRAADSGNFTVNDDYYPFDTYNGKTRYKATMNDAYIAAGGPGNSWIIGIGDPPYYEGDPSYNLIYNSNGNTDLTPPLGGAGVWASTYEWHDPPPTVTAI